MNHYIDYVDLKRKYSNKKVGNHLFKMPKRENPTKLQNIIKTNIF